MQYFAELCISSQFACAEIGDNGIYGKVWLLQVNFLCIRNGTNSLSKIPQGYHDGAFEDGMRKNDPCRDVRNGCQK